MKKIITWIMATMLCLGINAQQQGGIPRHYGTNEGQRKEFNPEQFKKHMREFVTREANLTEQEATRLFPMLNEMQEKQFKLMKQQRELMQKGRNTANLSEDEYEKIVTQSTALEIESKKVEQNYYKKFHTILSWRKIHAVRMALNRFQMEALKQFHPSKKNAFKGQAPKVGCVRR